jgi:signal recognition particle subunit SEC65
MPELLPVTLHEMVVEVEREVALRKRVYPRWVEQGKIKLDRAERQIQVMEAVAAYLARGQQ